MSARVGKRWLLSWDVGSTQTIHSPAAAGCKLRRSGRVAGAVATAVTVARRRTRDEHDLGVHAEALQHVCAADAPRHGVGRREVAPPHKRHAVADGHRDHLHARIVHDDVVELANGLAVLVRLVGRRVDATLRSGQGTLARLSIHAQRRSAGALRRQDRRRAAREAPCALPRSRRAPS